MKIRRYVASTLEEAVDRVKRDLGRDAIILEVRRIRAPGFWGWLKRRRIEVTAAVAQPPTPAVPLRQASITQQVPVPAVQRIRRTNPLASPVVEEELMPERLRVPYNLARHHTERLINRGVEVDLARNIVEQALATIPAEELGNSQALTQSIKKSSNGGVFPTAKCGGV